MIQLTERASNQIRHLLQRQNREHLALRIAVSAGGCSGFSYRLAFDDNVRAEDEAFKVDGVNVIVDKKSKEYLKGITIDYMESLMGAGFRFSNPNATGTCGCGESFSA